MTLAEAIAAFEADFKVFDEVGCADEDLHGRVDMSRAPNGERYITLTSGGLKFEPERMPAYFADEEMAAEAWLHQAWNYAEERGGKHLYWRERPEYIEAEYVAIDQVRLMNDPRLRADITLKIGAVYSRLLVTQGKDKE